MLNASQAAGTPTQAAAMQPPPIAQAATVRVSQPIAMPPHVPCTAASGDVKASTLDVASGTASGVEGQPEARATRMKASKEEGVRITKR